MKNFKSAGKHSTYTQLAEKLAREMMRSGSVDRISPGEISAKRARSRRVSARRDGMSSLTVTVVGGGIQKLFVICDKKNEGSIKQTVSVIESWAKGKKIEYQYRDVYSK